MKLRNLHIMLPVLAMLMVACGTEKKYVHAENDASPVLTLSEEDQTKFDYFFLESVRQSELGNTTAAYDLLLHCRDINPTAPEVDYLSTQYYIAMHDTTRAEACLEMASKRAPDNANYLEDLAQFYTRYGKYSHAIDAYERLYRAHTDRKDVLEILYSLYQQREDNANSLRILNLMEVADGKNERISMGKFRIYIEEDMKKAFSEIQNLVDEYPNDTRYRSLLGSLQLDNLKNKKIGLATLASILKEEPDNAQANLTMLSYYKNTKQDSAFNALLGQIIVNKNIDAEQRAYVLRNLILENEQKKGDSTKILDFFRKALSVPQSDASIPELLVSYMVLKKMPQDSIKPVLKKILEIAPDESSARLQLISYAWEKKDYDEVISLCEPATQYNPDEMAFYYYKGFAYYQKKDDDKALDALQRGLGEITPQSDATIVSDFYSIMGDILHEKGKAKQAYAAYDSCLQWRDDNVGALNNYAYYLSEEGTDLERAERMSYKTIKAAPQNATFLDTYAWILFMQKRFAEAKIYIDQALKNDTDSSAVIYEHAGDIYACSGNNDKAVVYWNVAVLKNSDSKMIRRKIKLKKYIKE
jgi:tetratricopeptide (TPR) repeat protein